jgi:predicted dinucleotide-binding enzyme
MRIATIGRGMLGSALGRRWEEAGHTVTLLGRDGGDVSDADAVLVAVPSNAITAALSKVSGLDGKVALDATNAFAGRRPGYDSFAHEVKASTNGPVAKAFNAFYTSRLDDAERQRVRPGLLYAADDAAREVTEQLIRDVGYEPVALGGLDRARALEDFFTELLVKVGQVFYRFALPGDL